MGNCCTSRSVHDELSHICTELWKHDENRLIPDRDYKINLQSTTKSSLKRDMAKESLFTSVDPNVLERPTFKSFIALLDNYNPRTGKQENITPKKQNENEAFIDEIMKTEVMKRAHSYLVSHGKSSQDVKKFKKQLHDIWFKLYSRNRDSIKDSSAFEHVFVGEIRDRRVIGFHNWIQFYLQERDNNVNYHGYINNQPDKEGNSRLITIQFTWNEEIKPVGSTFIGTSPEFEVALYTIIFLCASEEETHLNINGQNVAIKCYEHDGNLGTAYPIAD